MPQLGGIRFNFAACEGVSARGVSSRREILVSRDDQPIEAVAIIARFEVDRLEVAILRDFVGRDRKDDHVADVRGREADIVQHRENRQILRGMPLLHDDVADIVRRKERAHLHRRIGKVGSIVNRVDGRPFLKVVDDAGPVLPPAILKSKSASACQTMLLPRFAYGRITTVSSFCRNE